MATFRSLASRFIRFFRRRELGDRVAEELEFHLSMQTEEHIRRGMAPTDARAAAHRKIGNTTQVREEVYHMNSVSLLDETVRDLGFSLRIMRRSPSFALTAVLVLALGLGSSTAMFSALDRILFRPLPYADADRLVNLGWTSAFGLAPGQTRTMVVARGNLARWRPAPEPFTAVTTIWSAVDDCDVTEQPPERLLCAKIEDNFLATLGVRPEVGRDFTPEDDTRGAPPVALISHDVWTRRFGSDPGAVGRTIDLDGEPVTVVGVLPEGFAIPGGAADILQPQRIYPIEPGSGAVSMLTAFGRLKPGVTPEQAETAIAPLLGENSSNLPGIADPAQPRVTALRDYLVGDARRVAWLLLGAVGGLLLIACVNVANLILARMAARNREFDVRSALGAGRGRLARLALTETLLLAAIGGSLGLLLAAGMLRVFVGLAPSSIPEIEQASLDLRAFGFAAALAVAAGMTVGIWPALAVLRTRTLQHGARAISATRPRMRFTLVTVQIALTVAMLGGSALLLRTLWNLVSVPLGYRSERIVTMDVALNPKLYPTGSRSPFFEQVLDRIREIPGTASVTMTNAKPPAGVAPLVTGFEIDGKASNPQEDNLPPMRVRAVTPGYFRMFNIPVLGGRAFMEADRRGPPKVILSESAAQLLYPGQDPVGHTIRLWPEFYQFRWSETAEVIGIAQGIRNTGPTLEPEPEIYTATWEENMSTAAHFAIRTQASLTDVAAFLRQAVADLDPALPPVTIESLDQEVARLTERPRFLAWLLSAFAGFALLLAAAGLYGVASYLVTQRTRDIGVRMALGAAPGNIARQVVGEAGGWIAAGAAFGCALAWAGTRALEAQLYGVGRGDPLSWIAALGLLSAALLLAVLRPAARAAHVDPMAALRED